MPAIIFWTFLICAAVQLLFFVIVTIVILLYKPKSSQHSIPGISVIVCAKNECDNLKKLIPALLKQQYDNFEVILADDRSADETYDYAIDLEQSEARFKLLRIDTTPDHINNKKYAITLGIKAAKYDHVLLTDADCLPNSDNWISEMANGYSNENKRFVIGYSQYFKEKGFLNTLVRYETILTALNYIGIGLSGNPYMGVGRNIAHRKTAFMEHNGFGKYQSIVGGDDDLLVNRYAKKKNTSFVLSPDSTVYSYPKKTFKEWGLQKKRHLSVGRYYRTTDKMLLGLLSITKILFWIFFFAAIMSGYQTIFVGGGFFIVMVSLLTAILALKKKTGDPSSIWMLPFLDFIYLFYYITTGLKVLFTKKVKWN